MNTPKRKANRSPTTWLGLFVFFIVFISAVIACQECKDSCDTSVPQVNDNPAKADTYTTVAIEPGSCSAIALSNAIANIVEKADPAVVFISARIETESFFFGKTLQESSGSGVIVSPNGYIITNDHVVEGASQLEVTVPGVIQAFEAEMVGTDPLTDLAVIKIDGEALPSVPFADASQLSPGHLVIAMGYPLALDQGTTITLGVVSNTERSFTVGDATYYDVIQTDAAINQGNSGGPLLDMSGRIVGINSVLFGGAQNIGFAISSNTVQPVYEALISDRHRVVRPWLGVILADVTPSIANEANLSRQTGVVITRVVDGSPADKAGLKVRDVISHFEGEEMSTASQLIKELWLYRVGDEVAVTYWRDGEQSQSTIELTVERPE